MNKEDEGYLKKILLAIHDQIKNQNDKVAELEKRIDRLEGLRRPRFAVSRPPAKKKEEPKH